MMWAVFRRLKSWSLTSVTAWGAVAEVDAFEETKGRPRGCVKALEWKYMSVMGFSGKRWSAKRKTRRWYLMACYRSMLHPQNHQMGRRVPEQICL